MTLEDTITLNEQLVAALQAALAAADDAACAELLERRRSGLAALGDALAAAGPAGREAHAGRLAALVKADRDLQAAAATSLAQAGEAFRTRAGMASAAAPQAQTACLDRRA